MGCVGLLGSEKSGRGKWQTLSPSLKRIKLTPGEDNEALNLYKIKPGGKIPPHEHRGDELALVLKGSFSDQKGVYQQGDFLLRTEGESHRPLQIRPGFPRKPCTRDHCCPEQIKYSRRKP